MYIHRRDLKEAIIESDNILSSQNCFLFTNDERFISTGVDKMRKFYHDISIRFSKRTKRSEPLTPPPIASKPVKSLEDLGLKFIYEGINPNVEYIDANVGLFQSW